MQYSQEKNLICTDFVITLENMRKTEGKSTTEMGKGDVLQIRLSPAEKDGFQGAAKIAGIALSAWVRERLRWAATRELKEAGCDVPFLREKGD